MSDTIEFPIVLSSELGRELIVDCVRFAEGLPDEKAIRKKFRFDDSAWEALGSNEELIEKIEAEKLRRIRNGQQKRERAQQLVTKAPDVLGGIMNDVTANARHRIDSVKVLDDLAANNNGPGAAAEGPVFEIFINLGSDVDGKPIVEHFRKPIAIGPDDSKTDDRDSSDDVDAGVVAAIAMKKSEDGGNGEPV